ncbi:MAG: MATE family efflux transporter [Bacteroidales bacterium]|jgi:putative MATE family efflux protein|nr:MATE family efflux transporter [Bacteroidales bacterium]
MNTQKSPLVLGTEPVGKLLKQYALPAIVAMTASSLYNIVDSIFIGHGVGMLAIAGITLTFPLMNLAAAFGSLVGVGASTVISVKLGQKDYRNANRVLGNVLVLNIILGISFSVLCFPFLDPVLYFFGASEHTLPYARDFMHIILAGNAITHMYLGLNAIIRSGGNPRTAMYITLLSVLINCALAPVFIFGFHWGIRGAAWATVIAQAVSLALQIVYLMNPEQVISLRKSIFRLKSELVKDILSIGLSPFLMNICSCLVVILITRGLKQWDGDIAVSAYGILNRILFLFIMVVMGLNQGMQPIAGYNYGARRFGRVVAVTRATIFWAVGVTTFGAFICQLAPRFIVGWFTPDAELIEVCVYGIRIVFSVFPLVGFQMVATNFFLSTGKPKTAIFLSLARQLIFLVPCLMVLPTFLHTTGVWLSLPIADTISAVLTSVMFMQAINSFKKKTFYS